MIGALVDARRLLASHACEPIDSCVLTTRAGCCTRIKLGWASKASPCHDYLGAIVDDYPAVTLVVRVPLRRAGGYMFA